jgi:ABC-type Fe3+-hydroxamate transport system substrate-binding protein
MILSPASPLLYRPQKIISVVPSQTELLHYLGLHSETIGITKFCIHPKEWYRSKTKVGGTKTLNINLIKKLQPDLIIANKEENVKEQIEELAKDCNVLVTDVNNVEDALQMIVQVGQVTQKEKAALHLVEKIKNGFAKIKQTPKKINTAYLIWNKPYMAVGNGTFINDILCKCGLQNIFADKDRYPQVTVADLHIANPQDPVGCQSAGCCALLLLSTEPYPFKQKHITELQQQLPHTKIVLVDGEMFSWYGSRMLLMPQYLQRLVDGEL